MLFFLLNFSKYVNSLTAKQPKYVDIGTDFLNFVMYSPSALLVSSTICNVTLLESPNTGSYKAYLVLDYNYYDLVDYYNVFTSTSMLDRAV